MTIVKFILLDARTACTVDLPSFVKKIHQTNAADTPSFRPVPANFVSVKRSIIDYVGQIGYLTRVAGSYTRGCGVDHRERNESGFHGTIHYNKESVPL